MSLSVSRILFIACFGGCAYLALQPSQRVERWIDVALMPARVLGELASPLRWTRARAVSAAETALTQRAESDYDARRSLAEAERRAVLPSRPDLLGNRRFVHAEVVGRREKHADQLVIEPDNSSCAGLAIGMPVAVGNTYVGRIADFDAQDPSRAFVSLLTAKDFAVGARLELAENDDDVGDASVHFVAGGVVEHGKSLFIALHNPSRRVPAGVAARIDESIATLDEFAREAQGFELGRSVAFDDEQLALQPLLDYRAGVFQVVIVAPLDIVRAPDVVSDGLLLDDLVFDDAWRATRSLSCGEPARGREGLKLASGTWNGARAGAAVVSGVRFVGLVTHAAPLSSDVRTLGDPGLRIPVLARIWGRDAPVALGTFVALGRTREKGESLLAFEWDCVVGLSAIDGVLDAGSSSVRATLFTGSGDRNLPRGLMLGEAELPGDAGLHRILVRQDVDVRELRNLWLYCAPRAGARP